MECAVTVDRVHGEWSQWTGNMESGELRVQSGEWREESAVRAEEEAAGGEAPQLGITSHIPFGFLSSLIA